VLHVRGIAERGSRYYDDGATVLALFEPTARFPEVREIVRAQKAELLRIIGDVAVVIIAEYRLPQAGLG
jgi:hypothetical protein